MSASASFGRPEKLNERPDEGQHSCRQREYLVQNPSIWLSKCHRSSRTTPRMECHHANSAPAPPDHKTKPSPFPSQHSSSLNSIEIQLKTKNQTHNSTNIFSIPASLGFRAYSRNSKPLVSSSELAKLKVKLFT